MSGAKASGSASATGSKRSSASSAGSRPSLNVQLSTERLMRLAGEPDVSLDLHDRWLRGQNLMSKFDPESWRRAVAIFRDAIRENPGFSPCYSSLVQMNNIEHFVHPGVFRDLGKAQSDARTRKDRRSAGSGQFQSASVLRLVLRDGAAGGRGGAAHGAGLRAQRQRSMDIAVLRALLTRSADRSSRPGFGPSSRSRCRRRLPISNGVITASSAS